MQEKPFCISGWINFLKIIKIKPYDFTFCPINHAQIIGRKIGVHRLKIRRKDTKNPITPKSYFIKNTVTPKFFK